MTSPADNKAPLIRSLIFQMSSTTQTGSELTATIWKV